LAAVIAARVALIDDAIAIVVETVAKLDRGLGQGNTPELSAHAARLANGTSALQTSCARLATLRVALVDVAVAIVVEAVAELADRQIDGLALELAAGAGLGSERALAERPTIARTSSFGVALVDFEITVVVDAIAKLADRSHGPAAAAPSPTTATLLAVFARANSLGWWGTGITALLQPIDATATLVDRAITIVVVAVAGLAARRSRQARDALAALTSCYDPLAATEAAGDAAEILVGGAVAVVVDAVAALLVGHTKGDATAPAAVRSTRLRSLETGAHATQSRIAGKAGLLVSWMAGAALVDLAIAIVVCAITALGLWLARRPATGSVVGARL